MELNQNYQPSHNISLIYQILFSLHNRKNHEEGMTLIVIFFIYIFVKYGFPFIPTHKGDCSILSANCSKRCSAPFDAITCTPSGRPSSVTCTGRLIPGCPVKLASCVNGVKVKLGKNIS